MATSLSCHARLPSSSINAVEHVLLAVPAGCQGVNRAAPGPDERVRIGFGNHALEGVNFTSVVTLGAAAAGPPTS